MQVILDDVEVPRKTLKNVVTTMGMIIVQGQALSEGDRTEIRNRIEKLSDQIVQYSCEDGEYIWHNGVGRISQVTLRDRPIDSRVILDYGFAIMFT